MMSRVSGRDSLSHRLPWTGPSGTYSYISTRVRGICPSGPGFHAFFHLPRPGSRVAPSPAMSTDAAAERASQPAQRDELAHSQTVPIGDGVLPLTIDTSSPATTGTLESLHPSSPCISRCSNPFLPPKSHDCSKISKSPDRFALGSPYL